MSKKKKTLKQKIVADLRRAEYQIEEVEESKPTLPNHTQTKIVAKDSLASFNSCSGERFFEKLLLMPLIGRLSSLFPIVLPLQM